MRHIVDIHVHSKFSRATSRDMVLPNMYHWAQLKGIDLLGTGDFTHPGWMEHIKEHLEPLGNGLFALRQKYKDQSPILPRARRNDPKFILSVEISCIYSKNDAVRRVHMLVCAPDIAVAEKINACLAEIGNIKADGRPILGLDAKELLKICLTASPETLVIPAHAWTPWFAVFGSKSGFDTLRGCFEELTPYIPAIETGLSSDPAMNWRLKQLDNITLISNSDAHSPRKLAREATVMNISEDKLSYVEIARIIREKDPRGLAYTIEFFPEEGKYHHDGHRTCKVHCTPDQTKKYKGICPQCGRPLTVGVLNRIDALADRPLGEKPDNAPPFRSIVPLEDIIAECFSVGSGSKKVQNEYRKLTENIASEFDLLLESSLQHLKEFTDEKIIQAIDKVRSGNIFIEPGYDGVYGVVKVFSPTERAQAVDQQPSLFDTL